MDRISALRNIEDSLAKFEDKEQTLPELEREVRGVLRTYATSFDEELSPYQASGDPQVDGLVVVARSRTVARERVAELVERPGPFEIEKIE